MTKVLLSFIFSMMLIGCTTKFGGSYVLSSSPTPELLQSVYFGDKPNDDQFDASFKRWAKYGFKDADSIKYDWISRPQKGWISTCSPAEAYIKGCHKDSFKYGYIGRISVNAKNSYGGYIGYEEYYIVFMSDTVMNLIPVGLIKNSGNVR